MNFPDPRLRNYRPYYHQNRLVWFSAVAYVPFWGEDLEITLMTHRDEPTPRQIRIVQTILDHPHDLRSVIERGAFYYYQANIYGQIDFGSPEDDEECAPFLTESNQIWRLISCEGIWINDWHKEEFEESIEFKLAFGCSWDDEHGLGVKFRDWNIVKFGGSAD